MDRNLALYNHFNVIIGLKSIKGIKLAPVTLVEDLPKSVQDMLLVYETPLEQLHILYIQM
jgi:hypothetical protein